MIYRLVIASTSWEIGQSISEQAFHLYTYADLGIMSLKDWKNLFQVHLYESKLRLVHKQENGNRFYTDQNHPEQIYSSADVLNLMQNRGWQIRNTEGLTELYRPPSGKVLDEHDKTYTQQEIVSIIEKGYTLTPHA